VVRASRARATRVHRLTHGAGSACGDAWRWRRGGDPSTRRASARAECQSIAELERAILRSPDPQRLADYLAALLQALRVRRVPALLIKETDKALAATLDISADVLSVMAENVLLLQQLPYQGQLHRILSVLKLRFSDHDASL
jgi:circadian clock protein KaiC